MAGTRHLIDSNILIRWVQPSDPDYPIVESALEVLAKQRAVLCYTSQNVAEFWNACTRPADRNGYGLSPQEADQRARLFESRLRLLADNLAVHQEWRHLIVAHNVSGVRVSRCASGRRNAGARCEAHPSLQREGLRSLR